MTKKDFPGFDGLHIGEMVQELAEREVDSISVQEALRYSYMWLQGYWQERAEDDPHAVVEAYKNMLGGYQDEM